jgi:hypothetical protein
MSADTTYFYVLYFVSNLNAECDKLLTLIRTYVK